MNGQGILGWTRMAVAAGVLLGLVAAVLTFAPSPLTGVGKG